jgi:hypothetical protein
MKRDQQHTIDILFPVALFFAVTASALIVLLFATNIYQGIVTNSAARFEQETSLSYITEKIRQNDIGGSKNIYLSNFSGYDALAIEQDYGETSYVTYIYEADGKLQEIFLQKGANASAQSGTTIIEVSDFEMKELTDGLFQFSCTSADGSNDSVIVSLHSEADSQ